MQGSARNWLIRTKNKHILGPVTREKILELLEKSYIKGDDEICSGNGYWFFIKEQELVDKYLINRDEQPFNPVSEVMSEPKQGDQQSASSFIAANNDRPEREALPTAEDLEYPDDLVNMVESSRASNHTEEQLGDPDDEEGHPSGDTINKKNVLNFAPNTSDEETIAPPKHDDDLETNLSDRAERTTIQKSSNSTVIYMTLSLIVASLIVAAILFRKQIWSQII